LQQRQLLDLDPIEGLAIFLSIDLPEPEVDASHGPRAYNDQKDDLRRSLLVGPALLELVAFPAQALCCLIFVSFRTYLTERFSVQRGSTGC
jgi:hypothetical protein